MDDDVEIWRNGGMATAATAPAPILSICIPFFRFDVGKLIAELARQAQPFGSRIEILAVDDASGDAAQIQGLRRLCGETSVPVTISVFGHNQGRARIRNYLAARARGEYILFMDCDMYPDSEDFVACYFEFARHAAEDIVVGGCSYLQIGSVPTSQALYYYHSNRTQCIPVGGRRRTPLRFVFTNNMVIRRSLLSVISFDSGYVGWGYEDTDLAMGSARAGARIVHIDNTATHLGLIDDNAIIAKYQNSVGNFSRLAAKFPNEVGSLPVFKAARALSRTPLPLAAFSSAFEHLARIALLPVRLRYTFLQCLKISLYAQEMRKH